MNDLTVQFRRLLEKFRFTDNIPPALQRFAIDSGKKNLFSILKSTGAYSLFYGGVISLLYLTRKLGLKLSAFEAKTFLLFLSITAFCCIALAGLHILTAGAKITPGIEHRQGLETGKTIRPNGKIMPFEKDDETEKEPEGDKIRSRDDSAEKKRGEHKKQGGITEKTGDYPLGVGGIEGDSVLAARVTALLVENLKVETGKSGVVVLSASNRNAVPKIVTGSARLTGDVRILIIKLVDVTHTEIELTVVEKIPANGSLEEACGRISKKISEKYGNRGNQ